MIITNIDFALNQQLLPDELLNKINQHGQMLIKDILQYNASQERYAFVIMDGRDQMTKTLINGGSPAVRVFCGMAPRRTTKGFKYFPDVRLAVMVDLNHSQKPESEKSHFTYETTIH